MAEIFTTSLMASICLPLLPARDEAGIENLYSGRATQRVHWIAGLAQKLSQMNWACPPNSYSWEMNDEIPNLRPSAYFWAISADYKN
jgi:hypothetical protein